LPGCSSTSGTRVCRPGPSEEPSRSEPQSGDMLRCRCSPRDAQNADDGLVAHPCHHRPSHCARSPTFCRRGAPRLARLWRTGSGRRTPRGSRWITTGQMRRRKIKSRNRILNSEEALAAVALSRPSACGGQGDSRRSEASLTFVLCRRFAGAARRCRRRGLGCSSASTCRCTDHVTRAGATGGQGMAFEHEGKDCGRLALMQC